MLRITCLLFIFGLFISVSSSISDHEVIQLREEVRDMFYHGYYNYLNHAFPADELRPMSCKGRNRKDENRGHLDDVLGNYALTLVDSLDTLVVLGDFKEFEKGMDLLLDYFQYDKKTAYFDQDLSISVFETTIRGLGGLLSIHILATEYNASLTKPYRGQFLKLAQDLGSRLLPAFNSPTGIPFSRVNLRRGLIEGETVETCTAGAGTLLVEFGTLSRLTGDPQYEKVARKALLQLWSYRSSLDLMGNVLSITNGHWSRPQSSIGAGIDSFFEYLLKSYILFGNNEYFEMFNKSYNAVEKFIKKEGWYVEVDIHSGQLTRDWIDSLQAFWPALQVLAGDVEAAVSLYDKLHWVWKTVGFLPEGFSPKTAQIVHQGYPLRPEFVESTFFLYQATQDNKYLEIGRTIVRALQNLRVNCGFASVAELPKIRLEDRMDSFFLTETLKYLFLLFDQHNTFTKEKWVFSTEGHLFPVWLQNIQVLPPEDVTKATRLNETFCNNSHSVHSFVPKQHSLQDNELMCLPSSNSPQTLRIQIVPSSKRTIPTIVVRVTFPDGAGEFVGTPAAFGQIFNTTGISGQLVIGSPKDGCQSLAHSKGLVGKIVLLLRGNCMFIEKVRFAQQAGAIAVIVVNNEDSIFVMAGDAESEKEPIAEDKRVTIPATLISKKDGEILEQNLPIVNLSVFAQTTYDLSFSKTTDSFNQVVTRLQDGSLVLSVESPDHLVSTTDLLKWLAGEASKYGFQIGNQEEEIKDHEEEKEVKPTIAP